MAWAIPTFPLTSFFDDEDRSVLFDFLKIQDCLFFLDYISQIWAKTRMHIEKTSHFAQFSFVAKRSRL
jgi:hypothetical protein